MTFQSSSSFRSVRKSSTRESRTPTKLDAIAQGKPIERRTLTGFHDKARVQQREAHVTPSTTAEDFRTPTGSHDNARGQQREAHVTPSTTAEQFRTPTGFHDKAQGKQREARATLGTATRFGRTPTGFNTCLAMLMVSLLWLGACSSPSSDSENPTDRDAPSTSTENASSSSSVEVPQPDLKDMEDAVADRFKTTRAAVIQNPESGKAWGRFGMVAHAHELWAEAEVAYRRAWQLDLSDSRWPYYLGDVLSVVGTDLEGAEKAFRRALELQPGYSPTHMRLGKVLVAANQPDKASRELLRALELDPAFTPAKVTLAQVELGKGLLDSAEKRLDEVLRSEPRHAQALSTLGQVYMRQGKRNQARAIAQRAKNSVIYNLYTDPLMGQVVNEGVSSVLVWERAKAFLDNGDYEQASIGLEKVLKVLPDNPDAHQQLALAYRNMGEVGRAKLHLEEVLKLRDGGVEPRVQMGFLLLGVQQAQEALPYLEEAVRLAPNDPDAGWLLGRAKVLTGELRPGIKIFEAEEQKANAAGRPVPSWVHNDWGSALAQTGRIHTALDHFRTALLTEPDNPQSLFYAGLALEGIGNVDEAVDHYCRSMRIQPNPPAAGRLQSLGRVCS